jgi:hypothetical protein
VDEGYPGAEKIVRVRDNLSTHGPAALDATFTPAEARRWVEQLEIHYTPQHGSGLKAAARELRVLAWPCLDRRLPDGESFAAGGGRRGGHTERGGGAGRLAAHHRRRTHQAQATLPVN